MVEINCDNDRLRNSKRDSLIEDQESINYLHKFLKNQNNLLACTVINSVIEFRFK
jgi:hypothetical protein